MTMKEISFLMACATVALISACGGGGGSATGSSVNSIGGEATVIPDSPALLSEREKEPAIGASLNADSCAIQYTFKSIVNDTGADPLLPLQWHIQNIGQKISNLVVTPGEDLRISQAWTLSKGQGVRVAVIDDAVEVIHRDLAPNVVPGASFSYSSNSLYQLYPLPCNQPNNDDTHGTAVTGIIVARDNNKFGGAGVAPRAGLVAYNALATGTDADIADALTRDLTNNAILHNSWGSNDDGKLHPADSAFVQAIKMGREQGRNGKGSIYVFPAGNGGCYPTFRTTTSCSNDNANFDGYVNQLGQITVGAIGPDGKKLSYSEQGVNILVSAPAEAITTTAVKDGERFDFRGTSASAPMISGVVALMLSSNPQLTWRDVQLILAKSARKNDPTDSAWAAPKYGYNYNPFYGFGVPDAEKAVQLSKSWASVGGSSSLISCNAITRTVDALLAEAPTVGREVIDTVTIDATNCNLKHIEFIEVKFTADHAYSGDLRITLESPNGLQSILAQPRICFEAAGGDECRKFSDWQFGSVRHLDEPSIGQWKLKVSDEVPTDRGTWKSWSIKFYGR
jgi:proprotein convertase subtilisin/kexin type 2